MIGHVKKRCRKLQGHCIALMIRIKIVFNLKFSLLNYKGTIIMSIEKLNEEMFEQISQDEMSSLQGGQGKGTTLTDIHTTGSCSCVDANDIDSGGGCGCS